MANPTAAPTAPADSLGIDRAFLLQMAQIPFLAALFVLLAGLSTFVLPDKFGPVVLICAGMILAAIIDGWKFKVPNWLTLSLVVSGWGIGLLHDLGVPFGGCQGGLASALLGTAWGFALLFPMLLIGGMGQGDVKMQMGFGSWVAVIYGANGAPNGLEIILIAFCVGAIAGGVFGLIMMALRRQFDKNLRNTREILTDLRYLVTAGPARAAERAQSRRPSWVRLPYGVPLSVGFVGYLGYLYLAR